MSDDRRQKTGPLMEAALLNFVPTNRDLMLELRAQNAVINDVALNTGELKDAVKVQNGRVTSLEKTVAPINSAYQRFKLLLGISVFAAPFAAALVGKIIDHIWK